MRIDGSERHESTYRQHLDDDRVRAVRGLEIFRDGLDIHRTRATVAEQPSELPPRPFAEAWLATKLAIWKKVEGMAEALLRGVRRQPVSMLPLDGKLYPPDGADSCEVIFVNGAGCDLDGAQHAAAMLGETLGRDITLVYNATSRRVYPEEGLLLRLTVAAADFDRDVEQVIQDFEVAQAYKNGTPPVNPPVNPAVDALRDEIVSRLENGEPMVLAGHSQGTVIILRAVWQAREQHLNNMIAGGMTREQAEAKLAKDFASIKVINMSGPMRRSDLPAEVVNYEHAELPFDPAAENLGERCRDPYRDSEYAARVRAFQFDCIFGPPPLAGLAHGEGPVLFFHGDKLRDFVDAP